MKHTIHAMILLLLASSNYANAAQQKPITKALTDQERKECAANAEKFAQLAAAMGGKFAEKHTDDQEQKPKITDKPLMQRDVRARL